MRLLVLLFLLLATPAGAHGPAQWIQDGNYKNGHGELCCGERDCGFFSGDEADGHIIAKEDGYHVDAVFRGDRDGRPFTFDVHEVVPYSQAQPSPDGTYWRCQWSGERKCFFAPPPGS